MPRDLNSPNRRMRTRLSGGVAGVPGKPGPLCRYELTMVFLFFFAASCSAQVREVGPTDAGTADGGGIVDAGDAPDANTSPASCTGFGECSLTSRTCCGVCGSPTLDDVSAIRWDKVELYRSVVCGGNGPVPCPACASMENPHLTAVCRSSICSAIDVRNDTVSACTSNADCMLRYGTGCCETCGVGLESHLTAFRKDAVQSVVRCLPNEGACPPCVATYPANASAVCNPRTRRCEVRVTP